MVIQQDIFGNADRVFEQKYCGSCKHLLTMVQDNKVVLVCSERPQKRNPKYYEQKKITDRACKMYEYNSEA